METIKEGFENSLKKIKENIQHIAQKEKNIKTPFGSEHFETFYKKLEEIHFKEEKSEKSNFKIYQHNSNPKICLKIFQNSNLIHEFNNSNVNINISVDITSEDVFVLDVELKNVKITKGCGFSINTGILTNKIKKNCVLIPKFNRLDDICPIISVSDGDTNGPITINGFAKEDISGKFRVEYMAFVSYKIDNCISLVDRYSEKERLIKSKDSRENRFTINCGVGIDFSKVIEIENGLEFETFELNVVPKNNLEKQKFLLKFKKERTIIFSSRDREWYDENLQTVSGLWNESGLLKPLINESSVYDANVFCLTSIGHRMKFNYKDSKYDEKRDLFLSCTMNGSFKYIKSFKNLRKYLGKLKKNIDFYEVTKSKETIEKSEKFLKNIEEEMKQIYNIQLNEFEEVEKLSLTTDEKFEHEESVSHKRKLDDENECVAAKLIRLDDKEELQNFDNNEFSNGFNNIKFIPGKIYELGPNFIPLRERIDRNAPSTDNEYSIFIKSCQLLKDVGYID